LPGAPAPASRHPTMTGECNVPASLAASRRRTFPGCPVLSRSQKQQAPGSTMPPFSLAFGVVRSAGALPVSARGCWRTHWRRPETASLDGVGDSRGTIRKPGDGRLQTPLAALTAATRKLHRQGSAALFDRKMIRCGYGGLRRSLSRALTAGLDRMTVDTAWAPPGQGSWPQDGRSIAM
jgi:hypothetical protein